MAEILKVESLCKSYDKKVNAVDNISFSVNDGEIFALIGPNGAGKTTTIRMIATLISSTSGDAYIDGFSINNEPEKVRKLITYLPDEAGAYKSMTGYEYLNFMAGLFTQDKDEIKLYTAYAAELSNLGDRLKDKIGSYSRGMIRRLLLSRAVMTSPKLAIMDEATSGLDVINALEIRKSIRKLAKEKGISFLLSSHNMLEIEYLSDRVGIISKGRLCEIGTVDELKARFNATNLEEVFERVAKDEIC